MARRLTVRNPQSHRSTKKRTRQVPITPKLYDLLFETANDESNGEYVITRGSTPQPSHMHKTFRRLCRKATLEPWDRWCHTLRKNCETDWARQFPIHVVTEWLGNSPEVAMKHYTQATDADFRKAARHNLGTIRRSAKSTKPQHPCD